MREALFFAHFREVVLTAERSLLYALGFQLGIHHPYYWITSILSRLSKLPGEDGAWWAAYSTRTVSPGQQSQQARSWPAHTNLVSTGTVICSHKASARPAEHAGRSWGMTPDCDDRLCSLQAKSRTNFVNDMYKGTSLILRYDLRILAFAVMHITIPVMYPDINRPKADHDKVCQHLSAFLEVNMVRSKSNLKVCDCQGWARCS